MDVLLRTGDESVTKGLLEEDDVEIERVDGEETEAEGWVLVVVDRSARVDARLFSSRLASWEYSTRSSASSLAISSLIAEAGSAGRSWRRSLLTHVEAADAQPSRAAIRIGTAKYISKSQWLTG